MWERKCSATTQKGNPCRHVTLWAVWCFGFQGERFDQATWVESCGLHLGDVQGWVSLLQTGGRRA